MHYYVLGQIKVFVFEIYVVGYSVKFKLTLLHFDEMLGFTVKAYLS